MKNDHSIFIVDPNLSARRGLTRLLSASGYRILQFASLNEFRDALDSTVSGCAVLDISQASMPAGEVEEVLKECAQKLSIIVVSEEDPDSMRIAQSINAEGFFRKPVDGLALIDAITWTLRRKNDEGNNGRTQINIKL